MRRHCTRTLLRRGAAPLILLNWKFPHAALEYLWSRAAYPRVCADGAASRLRIYNNKRKAASSYKELIPDIVHGDLDSLEPWYASELRVRGTKVEQNSCQETNDLYKCVEMILCNGGQDKNGGSTDLGKEVEGSNAKPGHILVAGALGGRLDHEMANMNVAMQWCDRCSLVLLGTYSMVFVLPAGKHEIISDPRLEESTCGLIPLGSMCRSVSTTGLEYNLTDQSLGFGELVSSSNAVRNGCKRVTVETSDPLLWTTSLSWDNLLMES